MGDLRLRFHTAYRIQQLSPALRAVNRTHFLFYVILFRLLFAWTQTGHSFPPEPIRLPGSGPAICAQLFLHNVREPMSHRSGKKPRIEVCHL